MAWQLIYTSAPRSLEAGRSGFGTVARHRAISPLLVSAIERASQFSRLPGTDAGRVIFSHRIVAVAGGRFHVLSAIRDAGADYTGRTNHIAHHLIVDPREVAQLGQDGPSPADVLLAMRWVTSWTEQPRYFESTDEVALSSIRPQTNGSAWQQIAGDANQAWLLATGDASRGAYIIQPGSANLRAVFAESLRLIPERLWQISFTTSLQPSDEPPDFRWIGIEEHSPLRAQIESSGRPVLNLAAPDTLPLVEMVQRAEVNQHREFSAPISKHPSPEKRKASFGMPSTASDPNIFPEYKGDTEAQSVATADGSRIQPKWWLLAGAIAAVVLVGALVFSIFVKPYLERQKARDAMTESFDAPDYFPKGVGRKLADALITSTDDSRCKQLASASSALIQTLRAADLAKLNSEQTSENLKVLDNRDGLQLPEELGKLREDVRRAQQLSLESPDLKNLQKVPDANGVVSIMKKRRDEIADWVLGKRLESLVAELNANADWQGAEALLTRLQKEMPPPEGMQSFRKIVGDFERNASGPKAKNTIEKIKTRLNSEKVNQLAIIPKPEPVKPSPLPQAQKPLISTKPPAVPPQVPLYFVNGKDSLSHFRIEELGPNMTLFLKLGSKEGEFKLTGTANNGQLPQLRRSDRPVDDPYFELDVEKHVISPAKGAASLKESFLLFAKNTDDAEIFQLWVVIASGKALFDPAVDGIHRKGDSIEFAPIVLGFSGLPKNPLFIKLPDSCFATKPLSESQPLINWSVDVSSARKQIENQQTQWKNKIEELQKVATATLKDNSAEFEELSKQLEIKGKETDDLVDSKKSLPERCGGFITAVSRHPKSEGFDQLSSAGGRLKESKGNANDAMIKDADNALQTTIRKLTPENEKKHPHKPRLLILEKMLALIRTETLESKTKHQDESGAAKKQIDIIKLLLSKDYPLTSENTPPGYYRIFAKDGGADMLLVEIQIPKEGK